MITGASLSLTVSIDPSASLALL